MKQGLVHAFGIVTTALLTVCSSTADAGTTATGPYYANPAWDQQLPAASRFIVLTNWIDAAHASGGAAVLDRETGLVWEQSPDATPPGQTWQNAQFACNQKFVGGRTGWRVPSIQELASLMDPSQSNPALPAGHPFTNVQSSGGYWSATSFDAGPTTTAWDATFGLAGVAVLSKSSSIFVWCVRGGTGGDAQ